MTRASIILPGMLLLFSALSFAQEIPAESPPVTSPTESSQTEKISDYDFFLDQLIRLEDRAAEELPFSRDELEEIHRLKNQLEGTGYTDLINEAAFLFFLAEKEVKAAEQQAATEEMTARLLQEEKNYQTTLKNQDRRNFWKKFTFGSALVGAGAFGLSKYSADLAYDSYIYSYNLQDAYRYQRQWEFFDLTSAVSLGFSVVNLGTWMVLSWLDMKDN